MAYDCDKREAEEKRKLVEEAQEAYAHKEHWISPKEVKQYAHNRQNKGRFVENNGSLLPSKHNMSCIDRLYHHEKFAGEPFIDSVQWDAGVSFKILVDCSDGKLTSASHDPVEFNGVPMSPTMKMNAVYYQLNGRQEYYINRLLFSIIRESDYPKLYERMHNIREAFDGLADAMKKDNIIAAHQEIIKINIDKRKVAAKVCNDSRAKVAPKISHNIVKIIRRPVIQMGDITA